MTEETTEKAQSKSFSVYQRTLQEVDEIVELRKQNDPSFNQSDALREAVSSYRDYLKASKG